jgi:PTH1 family peptidyl-tRNA hydrolase
MNLSGDAVRAAADYYKIDVKDVLILHDDMDLPTGSVRIRKKGSSGGQKGMKSILQCLGTDEIARIRIGVGHSRHGQHDLVPDWVLSPIPKAEKQVFEEAIADAAEAAYAWVYDDMNNVMSKYNIKIKESEEKSSL